jgi:hypothetical protein
MKEKPLCLYRFRFPAESAGLERRFDLEKPGDVWFRHLFQVGIPTGVSTFYEGDDVAFINAADRPGNELFIRETSPLGQFFKKQTYYTGGEVQSLVWNGAMFMETWKSAEIPNPY